VRLTRIGVHRPIVQRVSSDRRRPALLEPVSVDTNRSLFARGNSAGTPAADSK
jgi:hypothetical protein